MYERLSVSPNPATDMLELSGVDGDFEVTVYDVFGRCVFSGRNILRLDVSEYPAGIYNISVFNGDGTRNAKFVKMK
jgi:hypothetical protein